MWMKLFWNLLFLLQLLQWLPLLQSGKIQMFVHDIWCLSYDVFHIFPSCLFFEANQQASNSFLSFLLNSMVLVLLQPCALVCCTWQLNELALLVLEDSWFIWRYHRYSEYFFFINIFATYGLHNLFLSGVAVVSFLRVVLNLCKQCLG